MCRPRVPTYPTSSSVSVGNMRCTLVLHRYTIGMAPVKSPALIGMGNGAAVDGVTTPAHARVGFKGAPGQSAWPPKTCAAVWNGTFLPNRAPDESFSVR